MFKYTMCLILQRLLNFLIEIIFATLGVENGMSSFLYVYGVQWISSPPAGKRLLLACTFVTWAGGY